MMKSIQHNYFLWIVISGMFLIVNSCKKNILDEQPTIKYTHLASPVQTNLNSVYFLNPSLGYIAGDKGKIFTTADAGNSFQDISLDTSVKINAVVFLDKLTGIAATSSGIKYTSNGGASWKWVLTGCNTEDIALTRKAGLLYACGSVNTTGEVWKSTDAGLSWTPSGLSTPPSNTSPMHALQFINADTGYVVGDHLCIIETVSGGKSWTSCNDYQTENNTDLYFTSYGNGFICGDKGTLFEKTSNGYGNIVNGAILYPIYGINFYGSLGLAVGQNCIFQKIPGFGDNENSWTYMLTSEGASFRKTYYDVCFSESGTAWAVGKDGVITKLIVKSY